MSSYGVQRHIDLVDKRDRSIISESRKEKSKAKQNEEVKEEKMVERI